MYPIRQNAATQSRSCQKQSGFGRMSKMRASRVNAKHLLQMATQGILQYTGTMPHRKNASAAKPQEAVQADRHSSERKSLIFSIIPHSGHKTSMRACSGKSPPQTLQALKPYFSLYSVMVWYLSWVRVVYGHIDIPSSCSSLSTWEIRSADLATMEAAPR